MKELATSESAQLSYYELYITKYLQEYHPQMATDNTFIKQRSDNAATIFEEARLQGSTVDQAQELAMAELISGLHFSIHHQILDIIQREFKDEIPETKIPFFIKNIQPHLEDIFSAYTLSDDFESTPEYEALYSEITGVITIYLGNHGIQ